MGCFDHRLTRREEVRKAADERIARASRIHCLNARRSDVMRRLITFKHQRTAFAQIAAPELVLSVAYEPGGSADPERALDELAGRRARDAHAKIATFGPHRDELALALDRHPVRQVASQGQHRAVALAMKIAESATIAETTGLWPIQLLDDISSELDPARTEALLLFLEQTRGQLFITGTREGLLREAFRGKIPQVFRMVKGVVQSA